MNIPNWRQLDTHPAAHMFPLHNETQFENLKRSLREQGYKGPGITLYEGKILDGRNRWEACVQLGIEPEFSEYDGDDPYWYAWRLNVRQEGDGARILTKSQEYVAAAKMADSLRDDSQAQALAAGYKNTSAHREAAKTGKAPAPVDHRPASKAAAEKTGLNERNVEKAQQLRREAPDLFEKMEQGAISLTGAYKELKERQKEEKAREQKREEEISQNIRQALKDFEFKKTAAEIKEEKAYVKRWLQTYGSAVKQLLEVLEPLHPAGLEKFAPEAKRFAVEKLNRDCAAITSSMARLIVQMSEDVPCTV